MPTTSRTPASVSDKLAAMAAIRMTLMNNDPRMLKPQATSLAYNILDKLTTLGFIDASH